MKDLIQMTNPFDLSTELGRAEARALIALGIKRGWIAPPATRANIIVLPAMQKADDDTGHRSEEIGEYWQ